MTTNQWPTRTCLRILANAYYGLPRLAGCSGKTANRKALTQCVQCEWVTPARYNLTALGYGTLARYIHHLEVLEK